MSNELLLVITLIVEYSAVVLMYKYLGRDGLYLWTVLATLTANIEVLILVKAFGMEMTLGNVLFATTFLVTDIASEIFGKKDAHKAVHLGVATSVAFVAISSSWLLYSPDANDFASPAIREIFSHTPRLMFASLAVYAIVQYFDVWLYHKWWDFTNKKFGNRDRFLWLRNNGSTLLSQLVNSALYTIFAFAGVYDTRTVIALIFSTYVIYIVTSLCDTPFVYLCRSIARKKGDITA